MFSMLGGWFSGFRIRFLMLGGWFSRFRGAFWIFQVSIMSFRPWEQQSPRGFQSSMRARVLSILITPITLIILIIPTLIYIRYDALSLSYGIVAKFCTILLVDRMGSWHQIGSCPPYKQPRGGIVEKDGKACPLQQFTKIVGTGHIVKQSSLGQVMIRIARFAQIANGVVGLHVGVHSREEEYYAHPEVPIAGIRSNVRVRFLGKSHHAGTQ